jgi:hypothetical protein
MPPRDQVSCAMRTSVKVLLVVAVVLAGVRAALPAILKNKINAKLATLEEWDASVGDVDLALLRGGLVLRGIKAKGKNSSLIASVARTAVNISWSNLLRRRLVASVDISGPKASMTVHRADREKAKRAAKKTGQKAEIVFPNLKDFFPFRIDRFAVHDGEFTIKEDEDETKVADMFFVVKGLTNLEKGARARGDAGATLEKGGTARMDFLVDPSAKPPSFWFAAAVKKVELPGLNPLLRSEFGVDVDKGVFELVAEATSTAGGFKGYVKPFVEDLKMGPTHGKGKSPAKVVKEAVVGAVASVLKNKKTDAVAAKVPFEGRYDDPNMSVWQALLSVLRNAFIRALSPSFDKI